MGSEEYNPDCSLQMIGKRSHLFSGASFPIKQSQSLCTSLLIDALNIHLVDMSEDGTLTRLWDEQEHSFAERCTESQLEEETFKLTVNDVGGIFVFQLIFIVIAFTLALIPLISKTFMSRINYDSSRVPVFRNR